MNRSEKLMNGLMVGKVALVTGAAGGIGLETAIGLTKMGARVLMVGRDARRVEEAVDLVKRRGDGGEVEGLVADLTVQEQVRWLVEEVVKRSDVLHVLVNNVGGWFGRRQETVDGMERTWALNHLAHVLLSVGLLELLERSGAGRVVNVASHLHAYGRLGFAEGVDGGEFRSLKAYCESKQAKVLFTLALARRLRGSGVTVNALHPGAVATGMGRDMVWWMRWLNRVMRCFYLNAQRGAETSLFVASSPTLEGVSGRYFVRKREVMPGRNCRDEVLQEYWLRKSLRQVGRAEVGG